MNGARFQESRLTRAAPSRAAPLALLCLLFVASAAPGQEYIATIAGAALETGSANGAATAARFRDPAGVEFDAQGRLWIADSGNHTIRRLNQDGTVNLIAGAPGAMGSLNGQAPAARFKFPSDLAIRPDGVIFISDTGNHVIRKISPDGIVSVVAGSAGQSGAADGSLGDARFRNPAGLALGPDGSLYVADAGNHCVRRIADGQVVAIAGLAESWGDADGAGADARFNGPVDLAIAADGSLYVSDGNNHTIRRISPEGVVTTIAGAPGVGGCVDGNGAQARFCSPAGLLLAADNILLVADSLNHIIRRVTLTGDVESLSGMPGRDGATDGAPASARFFNPYGMAADAHGNLYISDAYNQTIRLGLIPFRMKLRESEAGTERQIQWDAVAGRRYQVQFKRALDDTIWIDLGEPVLADGPSASLPFPPAAERAQFFRVILVAP